METETPLLRQYRSIKAEYPDAILMFRIGDFFEMLEKDAEIAARELELTLTSKAMGKSGRLPLAGVPHHSAEYYIAKLIRRGYHVAVCDQTEDPAKARGLVRREVTRLVTPGTYDGTDARQNNFLGSFTTEAGAALAFCDLLTGELYTAAGSDRAAMAALLARFKPSELLLADADAEAWHAFFADAVPGVFITTQPAWQFSASYADQTLKNHFRVASLAALGLESSRGIEGEGVAASVILQYLAQTRKTQPRHITSIERLRPADSVLLDPATLLHLEITDSPTRDKEATLLHVLDESVTVMGSRLLARRLTAPLRSVSALKTRHDMVEAFFADSLLREDVRTILRKVHDLERLAGKLSLGTITPREMTGLAGSLEMLDKLRAALTPPLLSQLRDGCDPVPEASSLIRSRLVENPPAEIGAGPLFREGVSEKLDALRGDSRSSRDWIAELQAGERGRTGINSLKVGFNNVFGYYIEVTRPNLPKVPDDYVRKQTTSTGERYFTPDLKHHEDIVLRADEKITQVETELFDALRQELLPLLPRLKASATAAAETDLASTLAEIAVKRRFVRPELIESDAAPAGVMRVRQGRHPVVEALLSGEDSFVPNDTELSGDARFMLLTGPNMAGKSTYIRQVAVIALMAQIGSYVPAESCTLTPFDSILTRIGASDRLARGLSTFMVEMIEAAAILRGATRHSLVVLDEIGRGTSTYDGLSIAWSLVEAIAARQSLALFATHYHELTALSESVPGVFNATVAVREWGEKIHFLHEIRPGAADRSYGIQVAALAGVPAPVIARAKEILSTLEMGELRQNATAALSDPADGPRQLSFWMDSPNPAERAVLDELRALDPDAVSPRDAHKLLAKLAEKLK